MKPDGIGDAAGRPPVVEARGIRKAFPGVVANDDVTLTLESGEVHALLGENGAGKSTLASILSGFYRPDDGEIWIEGYPRVFQSPRDALAQGVGMVHQHFRLVPRFTVAENIALGDRRMGFLSSQGTRTRAAKALVSRFSLHLDPDAVTADLSVGEQQRVEIVRMLDRGAQVLLLDEPTAGLTPQEAQALFETVRRMAEVGHSIVIITHKLKEVFDVADRVTVMRGGRVVGSVPTADTNERELANMMVGRVLEQWEGDRQRVDGPTVLAVEAISLGIPGARGSLTDISLRVHAGEIVGVAGVAGNGQRALAEVIAGLRAPSSGRVFMSQRDITGLGPKQARQNGLAYVPEDRIGTGLAAGLSVADNLILTRRRPVVLRRRRMGTEATELMRRFNVKASGPWAKTRELSGGNIQKVLLARELTSEPTVLLIASPTRGLDVGSVEFVRGLLSQHRARGQGILMISEDLDEILALSDRVLVIYEGRIVLQQDAGSADVMKLGLAMAGRAR